MTRREFLEMVIEGKVTDEMKDFARSEITKMNDRNAKRKAKLLTRQSPMRLSRKKSSRF